MRGSQPDAECPRCGNLQPPSGHLATCAKCGLVFPPHEILHRAVQPRDRAHDDDTKLVGPVPAQPPSLWSRDDGFVTVYGWTDKATEGLMLGFVSMAMLVIDCTVPHVPIESRLWVALGVGILIALVIQRMRRIPQLWLDTDEIRGSFGNLALSQIARSDSDVKGRLVVETRDGRSVVLATARDVRIADYLAHVLDERVAQLSGPPHTGGGGTS